METSVCGRCGKDLPKAGVDRDFGGIFPHCLDALLARQEKQGPAWASGTLNRFDRDHAPLKAGEHFRSFDILEIVARGGMGYVFRARQTPLNRTVALKILAPELAASESFRNRFDREAKILASLNHPNIVQVFDFGREGELLFLAMEHVEGTDLQTIFDKTPKLDRLRLLSIVRDVARGLRCIHEAGLVHRDIKPANILITASGQAKIADFGIAIEAQETQRLTETGTFVGTPHYVSPEHVQAKRLDGRSDLYSLGCILYQGLSGRTPFSAASPTALLLKHVQEPPPAMWKSATDIPPALGELVRKLLAKNPAARPDSAAAVERELDRMIQGLSSWQSLEEPAPVAEPAVEVPAATGWASRWKLLAAIGAAGLILIPVGVLVFPGKRDPAPTEPLVRSAPGIPAPRGEAPPKSEDPPEPAPVLKPPVPAEVPPPAAAPEVPAGTAELLALSPPDRRRRLEFFESVINLAGVATIYSDLKGMSDEAAWLRRTMTQTRDKVRTLVEIMRREGQNATLDDLLLPGDTMIAFDGQSLEKIGKESSIALLGTFVAKVKAGSRVRVAVTRQGSTEELVIRFDERPKDLLNIVQIVGLIPGQEVVAAPVAPAAPTSPVPSAVPVPAPASKGPALPVEPAAPAPPSVPLKRQAAPEAGVQKDAEKLIHDIFKEDYAKKTPLDKLSLAKKLLKHALEAKESGGDTFILLRESRDLASQFGDTETALKAVQEMARRYEINETEATLAMLSTALKSVRMPEEFVLLARAYVLLADEAMAKEDFEAAEKAVAAGGQAARKGKDIPLVARLEAKGRECAELKGRSEKNRRAREALARNPNDTDARNTLGQHLCFVRGDWEAGLEHLAKGSLPGLKSAAEKDLLKPADPADQVATGDLWWELAEKEKGKVQDSLRHRAAYWYDLALPQLTGIVQTKVVQRLSAAGLGGLRTNLFGHWKLDEGAGSVASDRSGNGHPGRIEGARWFQGPQGTALYFDGDKNRVHLDAGAVAVPWTASVWVNRESSTGVASEIMDSKDFSGTSLRLEQAPNTHRVGITKYGAADLAFDYQAPEGLWVHLAYVATEKGVSLYANGSLVGTVTQSFPIDVDKLGSHESHSMKGYLGEVRVYTRALTATEVDKLFQIGRH